MVLDWLNYHHLYYFWTVAREGSVTAACKRLALAPSTVSGQLRLLEEQLGQPLFRRSGRNLVLTDFGRAVQRYADEIFTLGNELLDFARGRPVAGPIRLDVGVTDVVPKLVVRKLLLPALAHDEGVHLTVREGDVESLLADLALHHLDVVIADAPVGPDTRIKAFNHELGECGVSLFATPELAARLRPGFPDSLNDAPLLMPTSSSVLRRRVDEWLSRRELFPRLVGEFQDAALLKSFGELGLGAFPLPDMIAREAEQQHGLERIASLSGLRERFYAISVERRLEHPAVRRMIEAARRETFGPDAEPRA